ncbi:hypothetical protein [Yoonia sp. 2307UL14-13]|uniref:hypothetical protein n=1 Tax=Yoonia sp. 2307UL14-13 TaxID=3126506 RepID=UPI00309D13B4
MKRILTTTALVALVTGTVAAEGVKYAQLSYDRNSYDADGAELDIDEFVAEIEYQTGQFLITGNIENRAAETDDAEGTSREISIGGGYFITPDVLIGGTVSNFDNDVDDQTSAGAFAQFDNGQIGAAIRIDQNLDTNDTAYLAYGEFAASPGFDISVGLISSGEDDSGTAYVLAADYEQGPIDARGYLFGNSETDSNIFGVRGAYAFAGQFRGTAGFESGSGDGADYTAYNIGAGYEITDGAWIDASIGQIDVDGGASVDTLSLSVSFETGDHVRLDRKFARDLREDFNSGGALFASTVSDFES